LIACVTSYLIHIVADTGWYYSHVVNTLTPVESPSNLSNQRYFYLEVNDPGATLNLSTPVIQTTWQTVARGEYHRYTTRIEVTTYQESLGNGAASGPSSKTYRAVDAIPTFSRTGSQIR